MNLNFKDFKEFVKSIMVLLTVPYFVIYAVLVALIPSFIISFIIFIITFIPVTYLGMKIGTKLLDL